MRRINNTVNILILIILLILCGVLIYFRLQSTIIFLSGLFIGGFSVIVFSVWLSNKRINKL